MLSLHAQEFSHQNIENEPGDSTVEQAGEFRNASYKGYSWVDPFSFLCPIDRRNHLKIINAFFLNVPGTRLRLCLLILRRGPGWLGGVYCHRHQADSELNGRQQRMPSRSYLATRERRRASHKINAASIDCARSASCPQTSPGGLQYIIILLHGSHKFSIQVADSRMFSL